MSRKHRVGGGRGVRPARGGARSWRPRLVSGLVAIAVVGLAAWWLWQSGRVGADAAAGGPPVVSTGAPAGGAESRTATAAEAEPPVRRLRARVVARHPHDPEAFTQGLLLHGGELYESTGRYGQSALRRVELATGRVLAERRLRDEWFGEGLARVPGSEGEGDRLVQLTWQEGIAATWRLDGLERLGEHRYEGEGWGLCHDATVPGGRLVMSDGSARLTFRDPMSFEPQGDVTVTLDDRPVAYLNELECVGGRVLANVLTSDRIVEIDPATGRVTAVIDASGLLASAERPGTDVLNGIAHDPADGTLLLTGKLWPWLFRVELVEE